MDIKNYKNCRKQMLNHCRSGKHQIDICKIMGISYSTLQSWLRLAKSDGSLGITEYKDAIKSAVNKKYNNDYDTLAVSLRENLAPFLDAVRKGNTVQELSRQFGIGIRTADRWISDLKSASLLPKGRLKTGVVEVVSENMSTSIDSKILKLLKTRPHTLGELSQAVDRSKSTVEDAVKRLWGDHYDVKLQPDTKQVVLEKHPARSFKPISIGALEKTHIKFGIVSDTHLGSKFQQLSILKGAYDEFDKQNVDFVLHGGDLVDGHHMYRGQDHEVFKLGADEQIDYCVKEYPKLKNDRKTYIVAGNHDESYKKSAGFNVVRQICFKRPDIVYKGMVGATFQLGKMKVELVHPSGGAGYALSYRPQKVTENLMSSLMGVVRRTKNVDLLPHLLLLGNWHVWAVLPCYQGMKVSSLLCMQSQTPYLRAKGLSPHIGFMIWDCYMDKDRNIFRTSHDDYDMNPYIKENDY